MMRHLNSPVKLYRESGMVLVAVMVFLFLLTIFSLGVTRSAATENRIALNVQMKDRTFSGAELALATISYKKRIDRLLYRYEGLSDKVPLLSAEYDDIKDYLKEDKNEGALKLKAGREEEEMSLGVIVAVPDDTDERIRCLTAMVMGGESSVSASIPRGVVHHVYSHAKLDRRGMQSIHRQEILRQATESGVSKDCDGQRPEEEAN